MLISSAFDASAPSPQSQPRLSWSLSSTLGLGLELRGEAQYIHNEAEGVYPCLGDQSPGYLPAYALHSTLPERSCSTFLLPGLPSPLQKGSGHPMSHRIPMCPWDQRLWLLRAESRLQSCPNGRGFLCSGSFYLVGFDQH